MTRESLLARRALLEKECEKAIATANALKGAIQDVDYWLDKTEVIIVNGQSQAALPVLQPEVLSGETS